MAELSTSRVTEHIRDTALLLKMTGKEELHKPECHRMMMFLHKPFLDILKRKACASLLTFPKVSHTALVSSQTACHKDWLFYPG